MNAKSFIDTNVFVYIYNPRNHVKQKTAIKLIEDLTLSGEGLISSQVVQEFCSVMLSNKTEVKMNPADLKDILEVMLYPKLLHTPSLDFYKRAVDLHASSQLSFYDALIVQAAIDLGCKIIYSEDLQDGRVFGELRVKNPFLAEK